MSSLYIGTMIILAREAMGATYKRMLSWVYSITTLFKLRLFTFCQQVALRKAGSKEVALPHTIEHLYLGDNIFEDDEAVWHEDIPSVNCSTIKSWGIDIIV